MSLPIILALAAATSAPATPAPVAPPPLVVIEGRPLQTGKSAADEATKAANQAASMSMFADMAVKALDRILPPQAEPEPARLALARTTMNGFMPLGSYSRMTNVMTDNFMNGVYDRLLAMTGTEVSNAIGMPVASGPNEAQTLRQQATKNDPLFDARMKAYAAAFKDEMKQTMGIMEPRLREGMARALARRFDAGQLTDLNRFFATDTGRAFGQDMMLIWIDGDVFRGMFASMPDIMRAMPQSAARFAAIEKQYPWPVKAPVKKAPIAKKAKK